MANKLKITTASLFGESCFRDNGTWYSDELNTSWALIVLTNYSKEVVIKAPKSEIIYDLNNSISLVHKLINNQRSQLHRKWLQHYCIVFLCGVMAAYFVTYTTISSNMVEWIKWGVPTVFMLLSGYTIRFIRKIAKELRL